MTSFTLPNGCILTISERTQDHLLAHPEITMELLETAISNITTLPDTQDITGIDLYDIYGNWGVSGLVSVPEVCLFAFRKGRPVPSPVINHPGVPSSILTLVTKPTEKDQFKLITAYCADPLIIATPEPITGSLDPRTTEGKKLREQYLTFWQHHAFATGCTPIDSTPFESTWEKIIEEFGDYYQNLD
jgi:hypothetical protein